MYLKSTDKAPNCIWYIFPKQMRVIYTNIELYNNMPYIILIFYWIYVENGLTFTIVDRYINANRIDSSLIVSNTFFYFKIQKSHDIPNIILN